ncbi:hypothetical protein GWK09_14850 [Muriicola jejuensis]|uniref:TonB-dependent receptor plug domain-containing protein n=1 Tax=Muriicola jejuensis TaxID=504488 RepID=A0A6P0UL73_9FLAO|nr:hypothetical protein [Muriicola jejuensis]
MRTVILTFLIINFHSVSSQPLKVDLTSLNKSSSLKSFVENQAFEYLEFNTKKRDSIAKQRVSISHEGVETEIIIRDMSYVKEPLIIINQFPLKNYNITGDILLRDIEEIYLWKPSDTLSAVYGSLAKYGLINIKMEKKRWRKIKKEIR